MLIKYADDITIYTSGPVVADLLNGLNIYLSQVLSNINNNKLTVSSAKSTVTLFTPDTHEHHSHPQVKLLDQVLPLEKKPKVLWATLGTHLTFMQHCNNIAVKVQHRNKVLKALAGSTWASDKETMLTTYQAICRSILSYCSAFNLFVFPNSMLTPLLLCFFFFIYFFTKGLWALRRNST